MFLQKLIRFGRSIQTLDPDLHHTAVVFICIDKNVRFRSPKLTYGRDEILTDVQISEIL